MSKEQIFNLCDNLNDQLTVLKGYIQLNQLNNKIDHSIVILREVENLERILHELINHLLTMGY